MGAALPLPPDTPALHRTPGKSAGEVSHTRTHLWSQTVQPSLLVTYLPLTSPHHLDPNHLAVLTTALALLEVHPDRAVGVAVTTDPALAR